jgi:hypothetical protein
VREGDLEVAGAEPARWARAKGTRGSGGAGAGAAQAREQARWRHGKAGASRQQEEEGQLRRRAGRRRAAYCGVLAGQAQAATGLVCREVAHGAGGAAVRRLRADSNGRSGTACGGRRRPLRRRQRTRAGGTASCSWRTEMAWCGRQRKVLP